MNYICIVYPALKELLLVNGKNTTISAKSVMKINTDIIEKYLDDDNSLKWYEVKKDMIVYVHGTDGFEAICKVEYDFDMTYINRTKTEKDILKIVYDSAEVKGLLYVHLECEDCIYEIKKVDELLEEIMIDEL